MPASLAKETISTYQARIEAITYGIHDKVTQQVMDPSPRPTSNLEFLESIPHATAMKLVALWHDARDCNFAFSELCHGLPEVSRLIFEICVAMYDSAYIQQLPLEPARSACLETSSR